MKLSLYCGLRAIAYIITEGVDVVKHGIKRVNIPFDNCYEFIAGLPVTKRVNRRQKRQMRRNLWRFKSRRENLKRLLKKNGYTYNGSMSREEILKLRVKGLKEKLSNEHLYIVLISLQQKRGYKSLRGVSDNENSDYLQEIERHEDNLKQYPSIAAYLLTLDTSKDIIFTRQSYIDEFNKIMEKQGIDEDLMRKIYNIIYYQNPQAKDLWVLRSDYIKKRLLNASVMCYSQRLSPYYDLLSNTNIAKNVNIQTVPYINIR